MNKKVIVLCKHNMPVEVLELKTFTDYKEYQEYLDAVKENALNVAEHEYEEEQRKQTETNNRFVALEIRAEKLELEVDLLRGRITEEEYNERIENL